MYLINTRDTFPFRYDRGRFFNKEIFDGQPSFDILDGRILSEFIALKEEGLFYITDELLSPDLISYRLYGDERYWWLLMLYNNLVEVDEIYPGMEFRFPSRRDIDTMYSNLGSKRIIIS